MTSSDASYELVSHLASGGMAELFLARRRGDGAARYVVLKRILAAHARNSHFVTMFLDEARLASRLNHPNIATLIDVGRTGDTYFYTMDYVHGENVRDVLRKAQLRNLRIPVEVTLSIVMGSGAGLHAAHELRDRSGRPLGIVHRDVSPSNVMVGYDGAVKVVDFGVAKAADRMTETRSGTVKGKIAYLSPEQCRLRPVDRRSDVFSLGIVAWELLTQQRLFRHESDYDAMHAIVAGVIDLPSKLAEDVPAWVDALVMRALERDVERRVETAAELAAAIEQGARNAGLEVGPAVLTRFMESLFGRRPEPWLDPAFPEQEPDTDVVSLGSIDASLIVGDATAASMLAATPEPQAPSAARPTAPLRAVRPPPPSPPPPPPPPPQVAVEPMFAAESSAPSSPQHLSDPSLSLAFLGTEVPVAPPSPGRRRRISVIAGLGGAAAVIVAIVVGATEPDPLENVPPAALASVSDEPAAPTPVPEAPVTEAPAPAPAPQVVADAPAPVPVPEAAAPVPEAPAPVSVAPVPATTVAAPAKRARAVLTPVEVARTAARRGNWAQASIACADGLRTQPGDVELTTVCGLAACNLGRGAVARYYIARLPESRARSVTTACVAHRTFTSSTECNDDPASCR